MKVVIWARVSTREQREGYSIDAQLRLTRENATRYGHEVLKEFVLDESARRGVERKQFNEMFKWVQTSAKRLGIQAILSHKLDRVCRNMRDAVRLQELEDKQGVRLIFVDNQFGPGPAGILSFNVLAAVAQYYSDNLRTEVLKGLDEKVRQGWPTGSAPFGYSNVDDPYEPVKPSPEKAKTLVRIFDLYSRGDKTLATLADQLAREGHTYQPSQPRFHRTALAYILNNRFYIGELSRNGHIFEGRYQRVIDRVTFDAVHAILRGRKRRIGKPNHPFAGGLLHCEVCGHALTGEEIRRKLKGGGVRTHLYYRCANNAPDADHPHIRWRSEDLEEAIVAELGKFRLPTEEIAGWFRNAIGAALGGVATEYRDQTAALAKRRSELANMQDRLLNAYLAGSIEESTHVKKTAELKQEATRIQDELARLSSGTTAYPTLPLAVFDWTQRLPETWRGSNALAKREILETISLNRKVDGATLWLEKRKPFDFLIEGLSVQLSRSERI